MATEKQLNKTLEELWILWNEFNKNGEFNELDEISQHERINQFLNCVKLSLGKDTYCKKV